MGEEAYDGHGEEEGRWFGDGQGVEERRPTYLDAGDLSLGEGVIEEADVVDPAVEYIPERITPKLPRGLRT